MPNPLHIRHLKDALTATFEGVIDLSDVTTSAAAQRETTFRTRSLAAFALRRVTGITPEAAAASVVDGTDDNGLDALYVNDDLSHLVLVQSKWHESGTGSISVGDTQKFLQGFRDLTNEYYDRFNPKVNALAASIHEAIGRVDLVIELVIVTSGDSGLDDRCERLLKDMRDEYNADQESLTIRTLGLKELHAAIVSGTQTTAIDLNAVHMEHWGQIGEPYEAYYGVVTAATLASWYEQHGQGLFEQNIRKALGSTPVNEGLLETLRSDPAHFWYFNNGVTILCASIRKNMRGGATRIFGEFTAKDVSVVNGAQTVTNVYLAHANEPEATEDARIWVRFISLEGCPENFAREITTANNTQNAVESRDFVSLDDEQNRIRAEMALTLGKVYSFQRGEKAPTSADGCLFTDAAVALACKQGDSTYAVIAKSAPGRLWDTNQRYYKTLFNPHTNVYEVWRCVEVMRMVDAWLLEKWDSLPYGRPASVAIQGSRIVLWGVLQRLGGEVLRTPDDATWATAMTEVDALCAEVFDALEAAVATDFSGNYITSLFKNAGRCGQLANTLRSQFTFP